MKKPLFLVISGMLALHSPAQTKEVEQTCDSAVFYGLLKAQVSYFDKYAWDNYQISNELRLQSDTIWKERNAGCDYISDLGPITPKKGKLMDTLVYGNMTQVYHICLPEYDDERKRYVIIVIQYDGEWGGNTSVYFYKKTRRGFRLTKKMIGQPFC